MIKHDCTVIIQINGSLRLMPGPHGFHVHERGDIGNGCSDAAAHYNPLGRVHGGPGEQFPTVRHVGDLGNIVTPATGVTMINQTYRGLGLSGPFSILGRTIVVHENVDDLGRGRSPLSNTTGNAGGRVACGIIGRVVRP
ncbi:unnamed protein product [Toxocara canis]|uniref:Superoxide dismutase [Cu-Zn] n=1 Tax=Toxocara canis TaxID=6265 RepID=A0A183U911_TOXCA|nr:unnamed protein product [Toxocara canis]